MRRAPSRAPVRALLGALLLSGASLLLRLLQPRPDLQVEFAGCDVVRAAPESQARAACMFNATSVLAGAGRGQRGRKLTLWIQSEGSDVKVLLDGKPAGERLVRFPRGPDDGPTELDVHEGDSELKITATQGGKTSEIRVPLLSEAPSPERAQLASARKLRTSGNEEQIAQAERIYDALAGSADPVVRARATGQLARLVRAKDPDRAVKLFQFALSLDREAGLFSDEVADAFAFTVALVTDRGDLRRAGDVLDRVEGLLAEFPVGRAMMPRYRAVLALARGDLGSALALLERSEELARRLDLAGHLSDVYQRKMEVLQLLGRADEARKVREALKDRGLTPCAQASRATNLAWFALLSETLDEPMRKELEEAARIFGQGGCGGPGEQRNALTNLARWELAEKRYDDAQATLERALRAQPDASAVYTADWNLTYGRLDLARSKPEEARLRFDEVARRSHDAGLPDFAVEAELGRAEALERLGREDEAAQAYAAAEGQLDRWSVLIPFGSGKQSFFGRYERGVRRYLDLLVRRAEKDPETAAHAACVARRSRARLRVSAEWQHRIAVAPPEKRDALDLAIKRCTGAPSDEQAAAALDHAAAELGSLAPPTCEPPPPGEALLVFHPLPSGWAGFAVTSAGTTAARLAVDDAAIRAWQSAVTGADPEEKLLRPFARVLADPSLKRLRLLPAEPLAQVELHGMSWQGAPLAQRFSVAYGVDSFRPEASPRPVGKSAVVVYLLGEKWKLYNAKREAGDVEAALVAAGWTVEVLDGTNATRAEVVRSLERDDVDLFHYAGHGFRRGRDAWDSALRLAQDEQLTIADVLGLRRVPRWVILSSCENDAAGDGAGAAGLGIAPAFVIAGAQVAVAMRARPTDYLMQKLMSELYTNHLPTLLADPPAALRAAVLQLPGARADAPPVRVLVP